ncbi:ATP-binding protein [Massilia sp. TS11]|uniref:ATP-binding protein n=1 Tax=Massilia sp. TS11 TaxID=2908003 RepID=UPI001EDB9550|nr:ATP-binding protein [Massilia sp. TS11]MCG2584196.1 ATP-binding protein [Massilia sp. TS11]
MVYRFPAPPLHAAADAPHGAGAGCAVPALRIDYHAMLMGSPDAVLLYDLDCECLLDANVHACGLLGYTFEALRQLSLTGLCAPLQADSRPADDTVRAMLADVAAGLRQVGELRLQRPDGSSFDAELRFVQLPISERRLLHLRILDITHGKRTEHLRAGEARLLEMVARGADLQATLDSLLVLIEELAPGVLCSILMLDEDGVHVRPASGPNLPKAYMDALDGVPIGPVAGSCGTAMYRNATVIVSDIEHDPLWADYKALALAYGLRACWSTPISVEHGQVLGSFAMYYRSVRSPGPEEFRLIEVATHLAGIAIERIRRERELARHREKLQEMVDARTAALTQANAELAQANETLRSAQAELVRRDKLAALGTLVAGMSHELNTPIGNSLVAATTLSSRADTLEQALAQGIRRSTLEAYITDTRMAAELVTRNLLRAAELVANFKQLAVDQDSAQRREFSATRLLRDVLQSLKPRAEERGIHVHSQIEDGLEMDSYPGPLLQVLSNLFDNCLVHAFPAGAAGHIRITAASAPHGAIMLTVVDDGAGIPPELQHQVFDPFFTTRMAGGSLGLGLHLVYNIVDGLLGGDIALSSAPGEGTTVRLRLPRVAPQSNNDAAPA